MSFFHLQSYGEKCDSLVILFFLSSAERIEEIFKNWNVFIPCERACAQTSSRQSGSLIAEARPWVFHEDLGYLSVSFGLDEEFISTATKLHYSKVFGSKQQVKGGDPHSLLSSGEAVPRVLYPGLRIFSTKHIWSYWREFSKRPQRWLWEQNISQMRKGWENCDCLAQRREGSGDVPINLHKHLKTTMFVQHPNKLCQCSKSWVGHIKVKKKKTQNLQNWGKYFRYP